MIKYTLHILLCLCVSLGAKASCVPTSANLNMAVCNGDTLSFNGHHYFQAGTYYDTLTNVNGCDSIVTLQVTVTSTPTSTFTVSSPVCQGSNSTVSFTGTAGSTAVFSWSFGGASVLTGSGSGPYTVEWPTPGTQVLSLVVSDSNCTSTTTTVQVNVNVPPTASFTLTSPVCAGTNSIITYTGNADANAVYTWNFAGGNVASGSGQGPFRVNWSAPGVETVTLTVADNGCTSPVAAQTITIQSGFFTAGLNWDSMVILERFQVFAGDTVKCTGFVAPLAGGIPPGGTYSGRGVVNDTLFPTDHGPDTITYTITGEGCPSSASDIVFLNICEGIPNINPQNLFSLYPQPAEDYTTINFDPAYTGALIVVNDVTGRRVLSMLLTDSPQQLPTDKLRTGVYTVVLYRNGGQVGAQLLVVK